MRIDQADIKLSAHTTRFDSKQTFAQISTAPALSLRDQPGFANLFDLFSRPSSPVAEFNAIQEQNWQLSERQQEFLQRFEFTPPAQTTTQGAARSFFDLLANDYARSTQVEMKVKFKTVQLPELSFKPLDNLRQMFTEQRQIPALRYDLFQIDQSRETLQFGGMGKVETEDGRTIDFDFSLSKQQQTTQVSHMSYRAETPPLIDPLLLDLDGNGITMNGQFLFDLDSDGIIDRLAKPSAGTGFLAYDRNQDGVINDGNELFGASSGNGFAELKHYDLDGNNWLDENDAIYGDLSIWKVNASGNFALTNLQQEEVGAIFLGALTTPSSILHADGSLAGQMHKSSLFLTESGEARTVHQVDLAKFAT